MASEKSNVPTDEKDDAMTMQERERYLKDHGIQIETPQDRRKKEDLPSVVTQFSGISLSEEEQKDAIEFVLVPHDTSKPMKSMYLPKDVAQQSPGDSLPSFVKAYFADNRSIDAALLQEQKTKQLAGGNFGHDVDPSKVSVAAMNAVAAQGSVETFPLVHPADTNQYCGVFIYLDEIGMLKKLPPNPRVSAIAGSCGYNPEPIFYGDVFIGRVKTKPSLQNVDFVAGKDTDRGAEWMQRAVSENLSWQQAANAISGRGLDARQESHLGTEGKAVKEGNYEWTQDDDEVEVRFSFDDDFDKKAVIVTFLPKLLRVVYQGEECLSIRLYGSVDVDGCTWTLDKTDLIITMEKANGGVAWPRITNN